VIRRGFRQIRLERPLIFPAFPDGSAIGHGQELAPDPRYKLRGGCCGVTGPNPQPLWIRNEYSVVRSILRLPPRVSTIQARTTMPQFAPSGCKSDGRAAGRHPHLFNRRLQCAKWVSRVSLLPPIEELNSVSFVSSDAMHQPANLRSRPMLSIPLSAPIARQPPACLAICLVPRLVSRPSAPTHRARHRPSPKLSRPVAQHGEK